MKNSTKTFAISIIILIVATFNVNAQDNLMAFNSNPENTEIKSIGTDKDLDENGKQEVKKNKVEENETKNISNYSLMNSVPADFKGSGSMIQQNQPKVNGQNLNFGNGNLNQNISKSDYGVGVKLRIK